MPSLMPYIYLVAIVLAWALAHLVKYAIARIRLEDRKLSEQMFVSGGMPSSHSAVITVVAALIGLYEGFDSAIFGLAMAVALIVVYDAAHVRYMAGTTAKSLYRLADLTKKDIQKHPVHEGHTVVEVAAGVALGIAIALVVFFATK